MACNFYLRQFGLVKCFLLSLFSVSFLFCCFIDNHGFNFFVLSFSLVLGAVFSRKSVNSSLLNPYFIFILAYYLYSFSLFGLFYENHFNLEYERFILTGAFVTIVLIFFLPDLKPENHLVKNITNKSEVFFGCLMILVGFILLGSFIYEVGFFNFIKNSYWLRISSKGFQWYLLWPHFATVGSIALFLCIRTTWLKSFAITTILLLLIIYGVKTYIFILLVALFSIIEVKRRKPFRFFTLLLVGVTFYCFLVFMNTARGDLLHLNKSLQNFDYSLLIPSNFGEFISPAKVLYEIFESEQVELKRRYLGLTYIFSFAQLFIPYSVLPEVGFPLSVKRVQILYPEKFYAGHGLGFFNATEGFINFGLFGGAIHQIILLFFIYWLCKWSLKISPILYFILIPNIFLLVRMDLTSLKGFFFFSLIPIALWEFGAVKLYKKLS